MVASRVFACIWMKNSQNQAKIYELGLIQLSGPRRIRGIAETGMRLKKNWEISARWRFSGKTPFVPVNINARYKAKELNYVLHDSKCKILFTSSQSDEVTNFSEIISSVYDSKEGRPEELIDVYIIGGSKDNRFKNFKEFESISVDNSFNEEATGSENDPAFVMYTSGTTSNPKGCPLSHKNVLHVANSMVDRWKMNDKDVFWDPLPMFHMSSILPFIGCSISKSTFLSSSIFTACLIFSELGLVKLPKFENDNKATRGVYPRFFTVEAIPQAMLANCSELGVS